MPEDIEQAEAAQVTSIHAGSSQCIHDRILARKMHDAMYARSGISFWQPVARGGCTLALMALHSRRYLVRGQVLASFRKLVRACSLLIVRTRLNAHFLNGQLTP